MEQVHRIRKFVEEHGRLGAIARLDHQERRLVEIVAGYGSDEDVGIPSFLYSGWCLTTLPHSRIPDEDPWEVFNGNLTLLVEPGRRVKQGGGGSEFVGVPYGATAPLILVYLQTQALRTGSRNIELGRSMKAWFDKLEKTPGGKSYRLFRDQAERIAMAKFSFHSEREGVRAVRNTTIVEEGLLFVDGTNSRQQSLFQEGVVLSEPFFRALREHAVPLEERALRQIRTSSLAIDTYAWLAFRLWSLKRAWASLHCQFGRGYAQRAAFKRAFRKALKDALAVYPEAADGGVEETETGLILRHVRPPVLERVA